MSASAGWRGIDWRALILALAVGAVGGFVFSLLGLPLAWMLGAMVATTIASLSGVRVAVPNRVRTLFVAVLGIMLGSAFSPEIIDQAVRWAGSLALQAGYVALATTLSYTIYLRIGRYDRVTAYFSSTPGGITEMVLLGESLGGDIRTISLNHAVRVLIVISVVPFYFRLTQGASIPSAPATGTISALGAGDFLILAGCGVVGYLVAARLRLPAYALIGPLFLSAAVHLAGLTTSSVPSEIAASAQLVVGTALGSRFAGISLRQMARVAWLAAVTSVALLASAVLIVTLASHLTDTAAPTLFLALAPGGLAEMSLIALALGVDTAFVTIMHFLRVVMVIVLAPYFYRILPGGRALEPSPGD